MLPCARMTGSPPSTSAMSLDVPPTSMVIRSRYPDERPTIAPPITPAAGPERNSRTGRLRATDVPARPPRDCMICNGARHMCRAQPVLQALQIAADDGLHISIERGDHGALVFAEGRIDLARQRHRNARMRRLDQFARALLVLRMQEREQIAHRDRLHAVGDKFRRGIAAPTSSSSGTITSPCAETCSRTSLRCAPGARNTGVTGSSMMRCRSWRS